MELWAKLPARGASPGGPLKKTGKRGGRDRQGFLQLAVQGCGQAFPSGAQQAVPFFLAMGQQYSALVAQHASFFPIVAQDEKVRHMIRAGRILRNFMS